MNPIVIREFRKKLGISQEKLAHMLGVTYGTVNRWEKGTCKPSGLAMEKITQLMEAKK